MASKEQQPGDHLSLSPADSELVPACRAAYSDHTAELMARFCQLAHLPFEPAQGLPPAERGNKTTENGREPLKARLAAGAFRLVKIFNNAQAFLAVREDYFAVLAFRGTQGPQELRHIDLNLRRVPLPLPGMQRVPRSVQGLQK
jgi:hypothetical protein